MFSQLLLLLLLTNGPKLQQLTDYFLSTGIHLRLILTHNSPSTTT